MTTFSDRLREERARFGLNQSDFGALGKVTRSAQLNYEKGERSPDADYLSALVEHGVDVHYLLTGIPGDKATVNLTMDQAKLIALFDKVDVEGRAAVLLMLSALAAYR